MGSKNIIDNINLNKIVDFYVDSKIDSKKEDVKNLDEDIVKEEILQAAKERMEKKIIEQISNKIRPQIHKEEELKLRNHKLSMVRNLVIQTIVFGFFAGLLVNQTTDILSYYFKGNKDISITSTWILTGIMLVIVVFLGIYMIIREWIPILREKTIK